MNKRGGRIGASVCLAGVLLMSGCGNEVEVAASVEETQTETESISVQTEAETETETMEELQVIEEREEVDGQLQSYLTGEWKDAEVAGRRPLAVMIPNNAQAMPQYGLSAASVIYEAPVGGADHPFDGDL